MAIRDLIPTRKSEKSVPVRRDEWANPFMSLQKEINRMFDSFFDDFTPARWFGGGRDTYLPSIDVKETDKEVKIVAELPGMEANDVDISLSENVLTIRGEKKEEKEEKDGNYYHRECSFGRFHREIPLPAEVKQDNVNAEFKQGVLKIRIPKKPEAERKAKKIDVKVK